MRVTEQWKFEQKPMKNKKVTIFWWNCDKSNSNWELCDVSPFLSPSIMLLSLSLYLSLSLSPHQGRFSIVQRLCLL